MFGLLQTKLIADARRYFFFPKRGKPKIANCTLCAIIPAVGVAVTVLPGLVRESQDEVDTGEDRPGITAGRLVSDKIDDIMEELAEAGII